MHPYHPSAASSARRASIRFWRALASALLTLSLASGVAAAQAIELGPRVTIDVELQTPPAEPAIDWDVARAVARSPDDHVVATFDFVQDGPRVHLQGVLPDLGGTQLPVDIDEPDMWPCPVSTSAEARFLPVQFVAEGLGSLEIGLQPPTIDWRPGMVQFVFVYADAAVAVKGQCYDEGVDGEVVIDVAMRPGWNLLASEVVGEDEVEGLVLRHASDEERAEARWYLVERGVREPPDPHPEVRPEGRGD